SFCIFALKNGRGGQRGLFPFPHPLLLRQPLSLSLAMAHLVRSRVIREAARRSSRPKVDVPDSVLREAVKEMASNTPIAMSLQQLYAFGKSVQSPAMRLRSAQFLHRELPIRLAQRAWELMNLSHGLGTTENIDKVATNYAKHAWEISHTDVPTTEAEEQDFTSLLASLLLDSRTVPQALSMSVREFNEQGQTELGEVREVETILSRFFTGRIGLRFLIEHHIESLSAAPGFSGIIESQCKPVLLARECAKAATVMCNAYCGTSPQINVIGDPTISFTYVTNHLNYMITELLKNSCRAVVEHHGPGMDLPPIKLIVAKGGEDICIKISDEGGGVPRSQLERIWRFFESTAPRPPDVRIDDLEYLKTKTADTVPVLAGYGVGLPLSRVYAQYFGGNLQGRSMEGWGMDTFLHLNVLGADCENLPDVV
ncbi:unnamed protein product, partial [Chrysoparadoxa australica]